MPKTTTTSTGAAGAKQNILQLLKRQGAQDAQALAAQLDISAMAVRQHLYALADEKLVEFDEQSRPRGRPAKLWRLTEGADPFFPDGHAELTVGLIDALKAAFGAAGMEKILQQRAQRQIAAYRSQMPRGASLKRRVQKLAKLRTAEGYMAEVIGDDGALLLVENHCPICAAATACSGLCGAELEVFQSVLGRDVVVERTEHILNGARRCAYRVRAKKNAKKIRA